MLVSSVVTSAAALAVIAINGISGWLQLKLWSAALVTERTSEWVDVPCGVTQVRLKGGTGPLRREFYGRPGEAVARPAVILTDRWRWAGNRKIERTAWSTAALIGASAPDPTGSAYNTHRSPRALTRRTHRSSRCVRFDRQGAHTGIVDTYALIIEAHTRQSPR